MTGWAPTGAPETVLVRATELTGRPLVSIAEGEALADVKDVVYSPTVGRLLGLTLNKRGGIFAGPMKGVLGLDGIYAIGQDAVMVDDSGALAERGGSSGSGGGDAVNVLGNEVLTDGGNRLGVVTDLIVAIGVVAGTLGEVDGETGAETTGTAGRDGRPAGPAPARRRRPVYPGDVVGYQITGDATLGARAGAELLVPLPFTLAVSGANLLVPASVEPYIRDDLSGFDAAVAEFRSRLAATDPSPTDPNPTGPSPAGNGASAPATARPNAASEPSGRLTK
jgi:sporulation protein YlmC with PRC-barrel domain